MGVGVAGGGAVSAVGAGGDWAVGGLGCVVVDSDVQQPEITGFRIVLHNFEGPFDLLLQLISAQKLDVTNVPLFLSSVPIIKMNSTLKLYYKEACVWILFPVTKA